MRRAPVVPKVSRTCGVEEKSQELSLEEKEVLGLILEGAVEGNEGNNCQARRLRERRKIGIGPILWGRTR